MTTEEGYIKFQHIWYNSPIDIPGSVLNLLNFWRNKLYDINLIGVYENGIGFGNISIRNDDGTFFITGTATGRRSNLSSDDYALVNEWQIEKNRLICCGKTKASSEALTHAAIYEADDTIGSVIHVHSETMWKDLLKKIPATKMEVEYGTPEMAFELKNLLKDKDNIAKGIVVMGGHKEGILTFGENADKAGNRILEYYHQSLNNSTISNPESR